MNSLERVAATVSFAKADRTPVIPQVFAHAAVRAGVSIVDYLHDGALLARCQIEARREYGYDAVFAFMDTALEAEAMGCRLEFREGQYPYVDTCALAPDAPLGVIRPPDPQRDGRLPELLRATRLLRDQLDGEAPVVAIVLGPMSLAEQLMGAEAALYLAADEPLRFEELLELTTAVAQRQGQALVAAGAQVVVVFEPAASPVVVPPAFFRELLVPRIAVLFAAFKAAGSLASWLHVAGNVASILPYYERTGADIVNLDYEVDPDEAGRILPRMCLDGNVRSLAFVLDSAAEVAAEGRRLVTRLAPRGGFILSSGCEIPPEARPENVAALVSAVRESS
jgi:uroporphyrinogen decarboxylase